MNLPRGSADALSAALWYRWPWRSAPANASQRGSPRPLAVWPKQAIDRPTILARVATFLMTPAPHNPTPPAQPHPRPEPRPPPLLPGREKARSDLVRRQSETAAPTTLRLSNKHLDTHSGNHVKFTITAAFNQIQSLSHHRSPPALLPKSKNSCGGGSARFFHRSQAPQTAARTTACLQRPTGSGLPSVHRDLPTLGFFAPAAGFPIRASNYPIPEAGPPASESEYHYRREQIPCSGSHILYSGEHIPCSGSHIPCLSGQLPHCRSHIPFHSARLNTQSTH